jgi:hypothetical protein
MPRPKSKSMAIVMTTMPCHECGEPTRAWSSWPADSVCCEDCSGVKRRLMGEAMSRCRGVDPALMDLRYDGWNDDAWRPARRPTCPSPASGPTRTSL